MISDIDIMTSELMPGNLGRIDDLDSIFPSNDVEWTTFKSFKKQLTKLKGRTVGELMTTSADVISVSPDSTVDEAANILIRNRLRRLPVVKDGSVVGIVTRGDILRSGLRKILKKAGLE
mmetsp:Transcript_2480/g.4571  ORF Transcript_2480/g.4571 Transcript_2480/m.4571 type:complete len:119 (-) Transcript_2480:148-504(-)